MNKDLNQKIKEYNDSYKKKNHIKNNLEIKIEHEKLTMKEINKLKQNDVKENRQIEKNRRLSFKA